MSYLINYRSEVYNMVKSICPKCNKESVFITWNLTEVKCMSCNDTFNYLKIKHILIKE